MSLLAPNTTCENRTGTWKTYWLNIGYDSSLRKDLKIVAIKKGLHFV